MSTGAELIAAERDRQVSELGYTVEHDAGHDAGDLPFAAVVYAAPMAVYLLRVQEHDAIHPDHGDGGRIEWVEPWPVDWDRTPKATTPEGRIRELVKAGALIAAEIDRLSQDVQDDS